jgi:hypothetical protein
MIEDFPSMGIKIMKAADNSKAVLGVLTKDLFKTASTMVGRFLSWTWRYLLLCFYASDCVR